MPLKKEWSFLPQTIQKKKTLLFEPKPKWIRNEMFFICKEDMPPGFDPSNKKQFGSRWCDDFMDRKELSVRRRTNKKKTSVFERLHMIHGYHAFTQYKMAFAENSSEEEESSSTDESS